MTLKMFSHIHVHAFEHVFEHMPLNIFSQICLLTCFYIHNLKTCFLTYGFDISLAYGFYFGNPLLIVPRCSFCCGSSVLHMSLLCPCEYSLMKYGQ